MAYDNSKQAVIDALIRQGYGQDEVVAMTKNAVLSQSFLRFEQLLTINKSTYRFPILANEQNEDATNARTTEKRLKLQSAFYVTEMMVYLANAATTTSTDLVLQTYPNPVIFPLAKTATGGSAFYIFYNGQMNITVNNYKIVPGLDLERFLRVPQTQLITGTAGTVPITQFDGSEMNFVEPNIVMIGSKDTELSISLPTSITTIEATPTYAVIMMRGLLAQNVTIIS